MIGHFRTNKICANHPNHGDIGEDTNVSAKAPRNREIKPSTRFFNDDYENDSNGENSRMPDDSSDEEVIRERLEHLDPILQERNVPKSIVLVYMPIRIGSIMNQLTTYYLLQELVVDLQLMIIQ